MNKFLLIIIVLMACVCCAFMFTQERTPELPEGFVLKEKKQVYQNSITLVYENKTTGKIITIQQIEGIPVISHDLEPEQTSGFETITIRNGKATLSRTSDEAYRITWGDQKKQYILYAETTKEKAIRIAKSI